VTGGEGRYCDAAAVYGNHRSIFSPYFYGINWSITRCLLNVPLPYYNINEPLLTIRVRYIDRLYVMVLIASFVAIVFFRQMNRTDLYN